MFTQNQHQLQLLIQNHYSMLQYNHIQFDFISNFSLGSVSASDTESVNEAPITASRQIRSVPIKLSNLDEVTSIRKFGKKRLRRYQNSKWV